MQISREEAHMDGSPFFDGVAQHELEIAAARGRLPVFYYDTSMMLALFPARYGALRELMPDPRFVPARLAPGVGAVAIGCLEHRDTDIGPYNEVGISIPISHPSFLLNLPGRALWAGARQGQIHSFVLHLPVTTEIARAGGVDLYNFPKFVAAIEFTESGGARCCRLAEDEDEILRFRGERIATPKRAETQFFFHLWMDGQPQRAEFKVNEVELGRSFRRGAAVLELAEHHPIARQLDRLLLFRRSLQYDNIPRLEAILYGPEHLTMPLLNRLLAATATAEEEQAVT
jgi:hypothetical protein